MSKTVTKKPKAFNTNEVLKYVDTEKPVFIYRNLHKKCYSVKQDGIVKCHADFIVLRDARFIVSKAGQKRVRDEKKKNVHAFVKGTVVAANTTYDLLPFDWEPIYYNPYQCEGFTHTETDRLVDCAEFCDIGGFDDGAEILAFNVLYK